MDIYDAEAVRAVWARVHPDCTERGTEALLRAALAQERRDIGALCALANALPRFCDSLMQSAREKSVRCREISAMLYLQSGSRNRNDTPKGNARLCPLPALRSAYRASLTAAERYEALAHALPAQEQCFCAFARSERCLARRLQRILTCLI